MSLLVALCCISCASASPAPTPAGSAQTVASGTASAVPPPTPTVSPGARPAPVHETDVLMQLGAYRSQFDETFEPLLTKNPDLVLDHTNSVPIGHVVVTYEHPRGAVMVTVGFARREQRHAHGETPKYVELIAEPPNTSEHVAETLAVLGAWMHDEDRAIDVRFRAFEPLRRQEPLFGVSHFLLVPAGVASLPTGEVIALLRVIPTAEDEYAHVKMRGEGAARAWWFKHRGDAQLAQRWSPTLSHD